MTKLVLVDDQQLIRLGIGSVLSQQPGMEVVGEAATGEEAVEICRQQRPDVVLMDIEMPEMDGLAATREIKRELPGTSVVVLTSHEDPDYLLEAIASGAAGYLLKDHAIERVVGTVRSVAGGESPFDQSLAKRLLERVASEPAPSDPPPTAPDVSSDAAVAGPEERTRRQLLEALTPREREILALIAEGHTNQQIADDLYVGMGTVKTHVHRIIAKLGVSDRTQAAVLAIRLGLAGSR